MLYLKNSLVNLTIIFFSLFFLTFTSADDSSFIFPKKKIITITSDEKKLDNVEISKKFISITLPKKNPLRQNSAQLKKKENSEKIYEVVEKKKISTMVALTLFRKLSGRRNLCLTFSGSALLDLEPSPFFFSLFFLQTHLEFASLALGDTQLDSRIECFLFRCHLNLKRSSASIS